MNSQEDDSPTRQALYALYRQYGTDYESLESMNVRELREFHLSCANALVSDLEGSCRMLAQVAARSGYRGAKCSADLIPLLFPHTAYKSYPLRWIEEKDFRRLTDWMQSFTKVDLRSAPVQGLSSVDEWIQALDESTDLRVTHTFGTSGKLSFIPRSAEELVRGGATLRLLIRDFFGYRQGPDLRPGDLPLIYPSYRHAANAGGRTINGVVDAVAGGEENTLFLHPNGRFSADVASLGGRLKRLKSLGDPSQLAIPAQLASRRDEFLEVEEARSRRLDEFLQAASDRFGGRDIYIFMLWPMAVDWAEKGLAAGISGLFGPGSIFISGGGLKGRTFAPGWKEKVFNFLGVDRCYELYGMTEALPQNMRCERGRYHLHRLIMPFVLDRDTGEELPRAGVQTGRYAAIDLNATTMWGGFVSGDQVSMGGWDAPCTCGREGIYIMPDITRYSEIQGGTDKISCAGASDAHDDAIRYLLSESATR